MNMLTSRELVRIESHPVISVTASSIQRTWCQLPERDEAGGPSVIDLSSPCIQWNGHKDKYGYGYTGRFVHRRAYEAEYGPIPKGMTVDHLCHNADLACKGGPTCPHRSCINVRHLGLATRAENLSRIKGRRTHCPKGHEYTPENSMSNGKYRACRICSYAARDRYRAARR